jgi:hypothetical protein
MGLVGEICGCAPLGSAGSCASLLMTYCSACS